VLRPQFVIVSGEGTDAWPHFAAGFDPAFRGSLFGPLRDTPLEIDPWDEVRWALGAASQVLRDPFFARTDATGAHDAVMRRLTVRGAA
jgi:hypothetical protein